MKKITMRLIALALLTLVSMGAAAQTKIVQIANDGKFDGGTIEETGLEEQKEGGVKVTITVSPQSGYTIKKEAIKVYATYPPFGSRADTRDIEIASNLTLLYNGSEKEDVKDASKERDYTFTVPSGFGAWVKEANFQPKKRDGAKGTDYSGVYYIANETNHSNANIDKRWYLVPGKDSQVSHFADAYFHNQYCNITGSGDYTGDNYGDPEKPFLTTYQTNRDKNSVWIIVSTGDNYYNIIHANTGKYVVYEPPYKDAINRKSVHLESTNDPGDNAKFFITGSLDGPINIRPMSVETGHRFFNPASGDGNFPRYYGKGTYYHEGMIGLYNQSSDKSQWYFEEALSIDAPTITNIFDGTITITADGEAAIYYTTDGSTPTMSSSVYSTAITLKDDITVIKAIAKAASDPFPTLVTTYNLPVCEKPVITQSGNIITITSTTEGAEIYYTTNGDHPTTSSLNSTKYEGPFDKGIANEIRAIATKKGFANSSEAAILPPTEVSSSDDITDMMGNYRLSNNFSSTESIGTSEDPFMGTIDGNMVTISGLNHPLVAYANGATIKNVILENVSISGGTNVGAICNEADGSTRIYNCGVLSGSVSGSNNVGGLVGWLKGEARVINCYSYANVSGGSNAAGIVGYNDVATTMSNLKTMVMNCMFYGNITGASTMKPVYGGRKISNAGTTGVNGYNYYRNGEDVTFDDNYANFDDYYCTLPADEEYLTRFEYYRSILNSNKKLCAWWINGTSGTAPTDTEVEDVGIAKWVLDPSIAPYPILKKWGKYPSVINQDPQYVWNPKTKEMVSRAIAEPYQGKRLGTISVTVNAGPKHAGSGATSTTLSSVIVMDMDTLNHDYCYAKIQLPYYNELFGDPTADAATQWGNRYAGNYKDYVVTGWKITYIAGGTAGTFKGYAADANGAVSSGDISPDDTSGNPWEDGFNFADRNCTNKDLYSKSGRVFAQGGYFYVPEGVSAITIEAYWGKAVYLHNKEHSLDRVNVASKNSDNRDGKSGDNGAPADFGSAFTPAGTLSSTFQDYAVKDNIQDAIAGLTENANYTVYDQAIVLVGNVQVKNRGASLNNGGIRPFTIMSCDLDFDNEPDYCLQFQQRNTTNRPAIHPVRFDFLPIPELGLAIRTNTNAYAIGLMVPKGHFEITETAFMHTTQFEYDADIDRVESPIILNGGHFEQIVVRYGDKKKVSYFLLGGHFRMKRFTPGYHASNNNANTIRHCAVNAIGGDFPEFYLSGIYKPDLPVNTDNPHCYANGGRFGTLAGAGYEQIDGNVTFKIDHAIIDNFFGGGLNGAKPITGSIDVTINNSIVNDIYCGGPKVGMMTKPEGKARMTVTTTAYNTIFNKYFGGGNGGTSYYREQKYDNDVAWPNSESNWTDATYFFSSFDPLNFSNSKNYNTNKGYHDQFEFEIFNSSNGLNSNAVIRTIYVWAQFGTTITGTVTNTLNNCIIENNFYGGGSLGNVDGDVVSTLNNTQVKGSVFGGGYSAEIPQFRVHDKNNVHVPHRDKAGVIDEQGYLEYVKDVGVDRYYRWTNDKNGNTASTNKPTYWSETDNEWKCYTPISLAGLGEVSGNVTLTINGTTIVGKSVYGGGEESGVGGNTTVTVNSGTIGVQDQGGAEYGNVYGGGMGKVGDKDAGYVKGNTNVSISQAEGKTTTIYHNVYGGGAYGSVGDFNYDANGIPTSLKTEKTGATTVTITGGTFGWNGKENGMVFGSSRGDVATPEGDPTIDPNDRMAWVYSTEVNIGTENATTGPSIKGSVYGSGENGHTLENTVLNINSGTIGIPTGETIIDNNGTPEDTSDDESYSGANYSYRGNVYGGGCGTDKYDSNGDGVKDKYNPLAGIVRGTTTINISGGHVVRNVYGAGAMGSVGNAADATSGKTTITVTGGRIGHDGNSNNDGCIFGAARGEYGISTAASGLANVRETEVNISYTTTPTADNEGKTEQLITGSVFGGGEAGTVKERVTVNMMGGLILKDIYGGGALADTQTSNWDATGGTWADAKKSALYTTTVRATGGIVKEEIFGGALGEAGTTQNPTGKPAYVWGDVLVDLNGTTTMGSDGKPMTEGNAIADNAKGCVVGRVFGCNNANGTPKGDVMVHVYATQNVAAEKIANTLATGTEGEEGYTPADNTQKVSNRYDVSAVYGGGNEAAYNPVTPYDGSTGAKTQVIIDGCERTSINTVYGGGNAAAVPETNVNIRGTFEIFNVFGGGNGKDKKSDGSDNPGADVGTLDQGTSEYGTGNVNTLLEGGLIHEAYGGSNQKGIIKGNINLITDPKDPAVLGYCELEVPKIVGAGKYADVDGDVNMTLSCQPDRKVNLLFAGADEANVNGNITLNITNGHFGQVFGGNNLGGAIKGKITVNVEEKGCQPIKIDNLYLGSNEAAYSVFGYYESEETHSVTGKKILKPRESEDDTHTPVENPATDATHSFPYAQPELNIISCTYIGNVFGGGLGEKAVMYANPTVNVNMEPGLYAKDETVGVPKVMEGLGLAASENPDKLGIIENVYGGGDAANIEGNTTVNIATETGKGAYIIGNVFGGGNGVMDNLDLGKIIGNTHVIIGDGTDNANLHIKCSAYGGGNIGMVTGNTEVDVNNGIIGTDQKGGYKWGNVYGGGKGKIVETEGQSAQLVMNSIADVDAGLVKGNTTITINGTAKTTQILHNVYGGGAVGSVGTFTRDETTGLPIACADNTGLTTVTINGGTIGHDRKDTGMVNGSSRGWEGNPEGSYLNQLAWVNNTNVIIGDASSDAGPSILGSVYGGGENGHNFKNGVVTVNKGTIGYEEGTWDCGNIYGAGSGTDTYTIGESTTEHHNPMAGCVRGTTSITVNGGNILRNVYGGGSMGSVGGGTTADAGKTTIAINGGTIGETNTDYGHVFGGPKGNLSETEFSASVWETQVNINTGADIKGSVFGGGEAGIVKGSVVVNMKGGEVAKDVYGGGALASTNTESGATVVNLTGGHIKSDVYGGGLGQIEVKEDDVIKKPGIAATVGTTTVNLNENVDDGSKGCVVEENIFGCNNQNGTPLGDVTVHIYKTQRNGATRITNTDTDKTAKVKGTKTNGEYDPSSFDIKAVYGGGNLSAYEPTDLENSKANVIIDGCERTSICQVYGGGNAASTPASNVTVNGTFEIGELFGGGNGLDDILINGVTMPNPGANVGYKDYSEYYKDGETWKVRDKEDADTKEKRTGSSYVYGTGKASVNIFGGTIHRVFGGSNTKGNVRQTAVTLLDEAGGCEFCVDEAYGGGKSAEMDAEAQLLMACIPGLQAVYGGAEAADVRGNVTLNITNGTFDRVFGGNNVSGTISGAITINVEEIGCKPVKIGQLYGGGNQAGYSVYGYDSEGKPVESGTTPLYNDPQVNVKSFTSIGKVFGGGFGSGATMVGNPTVNVNEVYGKYYNDDVSVVGENAKTPNGYPIPSHAKGKMGAISEIFGGGNAAKVIGNTTVNIGTQSEVYVVKQVTSGATLPDGCYTRNDDGTYDSATGTASADITYYEKKDVLGADIRGNVYGGGNEAEVTGNTEVVIGQRKE